MVVVQLLLGHRQIADLHRLETAFTEPVNRAGRQYKQLVNVLPPGVLFNLGHQAIAAAGAAVVRVDRHASHLRHRIFREGIECGAANHHAIPLDDAKVLNLHLQLLTRAPDQYAFGFQRPDQIQDAANFIVHSFGLAHENFEGFGVRNEAPADNVLLTAEGELGGLQKVYIPKNLFDFDLAFVLNMLAHEMLHVRQKAPGNVVEDKNEREWQAYCEMLFHENFPKIPDAADFFRKQFAVKALEYYRRMGEGSELQAKYADQKQKVERLLDDILIKRGEKQI